MRMNFRFYFEIFEKLDKIFITFNTIYTFL